MMHSKKISAGSIVFQIKIHIQLLMWQKCLGLKLLSVNQDPRKICFKSINKNFTK